MPRREQLLQLNWVRGIAALLVVAYHCEITMLMPKYFGAGTLPLFKAGHAGVQLFFVLSGFVVYLAHHQDAERNSTAIFRFAAKRFRRLYPALWVVLVPLVILSLLGFSTKVPTVTDILAAFLISPAQQEVVLATEWTLRHEIIFYALFALFVWNRKIGFPLLLTWGLVALPLAAFEGKGWLIDFIFSLNHILFLAGMSVAWLYVRGYSAGGPFFLAAGILVFSVTFYVESSQSHLTNLRLLLLGLGATGIIYGLCSIPRLNRRVALLEEAGASSYALYLIHYPLISLLVKLAVQLDKSMAAPRVLYFVVIVTACQLGAVVFHRLIEAPLMRASWMQSVLSLSPPANKPV
ncbi:acyltransferase [Bradyrhizobium sp. URHA0013]|uniref:acyltransferase family protein n=1 Tax=Bradyrhizobium sp. URHA0013 TaxID=1380352 RepID=UPI000686F6D2|nr:acyltransferase [Bradyrhizobium sp. URHA0013]